MKHNAEILIVSILAVVFSSEVKLMSDVQFGIHSSVR